jgi:hypothetical protein
MRFVFSGMAILFISCFVFAQSPEPGSVVSKVSEGRNGIKSLHLVVRLEMKKLHDGKVSSRTQSREIWKSGEKYRTDAVTLVDTNRPEDVSVRQVVCRNCERPGYAVTMRRGPDLVTPVIFEKLDAEFKKRDSDGFDWRLIGLNNNGMNQVNPFESLNQLARAKVVAEESGQGPESKLVFRDVVKNQWHQLWEFAPQKGFNPTKISVQEIVDGKLTFEKVTTTDYRQDERSRIWFPSKMRHKRILEGRVHLEMELTFEVVELNQPIDENVFTLASMDIMPNTPIELPEIKKASDYPTWQEGKIDPKRKFGEIVTEARQKMLDHAPEPQPDARRSFGDRFWPYLIAAGLAVVGFYFLRSRRRKAE